MALCLGLSGALMQGPALGQEFCSEPVPPYCVDQDAEFDTVLQVNRCEDDLKDYGEQLNEYEQCITGQLKALRDELTNARDAIENAKQNF